MTGTPGTITRKAAIAVAACCLAAMVGCTDKPSEGPSSSSTPSVEAVPVQPEQGTGASDGGGAVPGTPDAEAPGAPSPEQQQAASDYLTVRENAESVAYPGAPDWEAAMRGVTTPEGFDSAMATSRPADTSPARTAASTYGYVVRVGISGCTLNPAYDNTETDAAIQCALVDVVTTPDGTVVTDVSSAWPYYGAQDGPLLLLTNVGGKWLVSADNTNTAG